MCVCCSCVFLRFSVFLYVDACASSFVYAMSALAWSFSQSFRDILMLRLSCSCFCCWRCSLPFCLSCWTAPFVCHVGWLRWCNFLLWWWAEFRLRSSRLPGVVEGSSFSEDAKVVQKPEYFAILVLGVPDNGYGEP